MDHVGPGPECTRGSVPYNNDITILEEYRRLIMSSKAHPQLPQRNSMVNARPPRSLPGTLPAIASHLRLMSCPESAKANFSMNTVVRLQGHPSLSIDHENVQPSNKDDLFRGGPIRSVVVAEHDCRRFHKTLAQQLVCILLPILFQDPSNHHRHIPS